MKSPEEIADEIVETANDATRIVDGAHSCPAGHDDEDVDYFCCGCLRSMIAAAIREAEIRGVAWGIDAARAAHNAAKGACESRDCCEGITTIALRSLDPAAISAERSAGTSPNDRLVTPKLAVAARSAPAPVRPPAVRVPTPEEIAAMPLEQVAAETARLKRETGAVGGISRCEPAPACARCGGSGEIVAHASAVRNPGGGIERIVRRFDPCPECRGKP